MRMFPIVILAATLASPSLAGVSLLGATPTLDSVLSVGSSATSPTDVSVFTDDSVVGENSKDIHLETGETTALASDYSGSLLLRTGDGIHSGGVTVRTGDSLDSGEAGDIDMRVGLSGSGTGLIRLRTGESSGGASPMDPNFVLERHDGTDMLSTLVNGTGRIHAGWSLESGISFLKSSEPSDPADGAAILWFSNGIGAGSDGDLMFKKNVSGTTITNTVDITAL